MANPIEANNMALESCCKTAPSTCWKFSLISYGERVIWKNVKFRKPNSWVRFFDVISKRLIQLRQMIWCWKAYENALLFHVQSFFSNFEWFKSNVENNTSSIEFVFSIYFLTIHPNAANDMALESLNKCETFWYVLFLPIFYGFKPVSKMQKKIFSP